MQDYSILLGALENVLGKSHKRARDNHAFHCPFCSHKKMKLEIKLGTTERAVKGVVISSSFVTFAKDVF